MKHRITTITLWLLLASTAFGQIRVFNWNNGENETAADPIGSRGFSPRWQYQRLLDDDPLLPTFEFYDPLERNGNPDDFYYRELFTYAKGHGLPVNFVMRNLADIPRINDFPVTEETGFLLTADGTLVKKMSPFGPVDGWRYLGQRIATELKPFHDDYPHAPWVMLSDNNEAGEAEIGESLRDPRCPQRIKDLDSQSQRDAAAGEPHPPAAGGLEL